MLLLLHHWIDQTQLTMLTLITIVVVALFLDKGWNALSDKQAWLSWWWSWWLPQCSYSPGSLECQLNFPPHWKQQNIGIINIFLAYGLTLSMDLLTAACLYLLRTCTYYSRVGYPTLLCTSIFLQHVNYNLQLHVTLNLALYSAWKKSISHLSSLWWNVSIIIVVTLLSS